MMKAVHERSPTVALLSGLFLTLLIVVAYSSYVSMQISGLRSVQKDLAGQSRKDSLLLLRIQNDLNTLAIAMRDMLDGDEPYSLVAWKAQFQRVREDLNQAFYQEEQLFFVRRTPELRQYLSDSLVQFWDATDRMFTLAELKSEAEARDQIRLSLQARQQAISTAVARLLVENSASDEQTSERINLIYDSVQSQAYVFLTGSLIAILLTGLYLTYSNRRLFGEISRLSAQRGELAQKLIATQESTLHHLSRELHDEFGQILTAIGAMLSRIHRQGHANSLLAADLLEVRDITQATLAKVRELSQALHPVMLDEAGLAPTLDWYLPSLQKRTGLKVEFETSGTPFALGAGARIHIFRVLQEALNNVVRHSGSSSARVNLEYGALTLALEVEDGGSGIAIRPSQHGIGLVAMRERAELIGGTIEFLRPPRGGTLVRLCAPRTLVEEDESQVFTPSPTRQAYHGPVSVSGAPK